MAMPRAAALLERHRVLAVALALSFAAHAAIFAGIPARLAAIEQGPMASYSATLEPAATTADLAPLPEMAPVPMPKLRRLARRAPPPPIVEAPVLLAQADVAAEPAIEIPPDLPPLEEPQLLAMASPAVPLQDAEPDKFPVAALPASISISYQITSAFADGRAVYSWEREGDNYRISGEAEAEGFFTLFLEGQIHQESRGTVSDLGLRPDSFVETRPNSEREGVEFDWRARQVKLFRGDDSKMSALADNTVDWLSMIFQLAHVPPGGETTSLQVFTQRKMYRFRLQVLGVEQIEIPIGNVRALHLRHIDPEDSREVVDVWLGLEQHNLPVKLRFPVARNRLMVEQVATQVSTR
jgi:hypothetical protein